MKKAVNTLSFFFFLNVFFAQHQTSVQKYRIDSLKKELSLASEDTTKLRLLYFFGETQKISRTGFWDSMLTQTSYHNLRVLEIRSCLKLARLMSIQGKKERALELHNRALSLARVEANNHELLSSLYWMASYHVFHLNYKLALDFCYEGIRLAEKTNDKKRLASFKTILAKIYSANGEKRKALETDKEALKTFEELNMNRELVSLLCDMGTLCQHLADTPAVVNYFFRTLKYAPELVNSHDEVEIYKAVSSAYTFKGRYDSSELYIKKALAVSKSINDEIGQLGALDILADLNYKNNQLKKAKYYAQMVIDLSLKANFLAQIPTATATLKKIYLKEKNYQDALKTFELQVAVQTQLSDEKTRKQALEKEFTYNLEKKENENKLLAQQNQIQNLRLRQNNYFISGMGVVLLLICLLGYLIFRQNRIKGEQQRSQLEQKLLRSQMNPHFIFNSLQAIQNFVLRHNEKEAVKYLSSFASITRDVLENSRMEAISLKKEIALLENYLQLQSIRFRGKFDYQIKVDEKIDIENTMVPPMLSQPFIENAVEHGFHDIANDGKITVCYHLENSNLIMEITDNGMGMKDNQTPNKKHRSLALEITKERVILMNKKLNGKVIFTITEAFPMAQVRKGVNVVFSIPLNFQG